MKALLIAIGATVWIAGNALAQQHIPSPPPAPLSPPASSAQMLGISSDVVLGTVSNAVDIKTYHRATYGLVEFAVDDIITNGGKLTVGKTIRAWVQLQDSPLLKKPDYFAGILWFHFGNLTAEDALREEMTGKRYFFGLKDATYEKSPFPPWTARVWPETMSEWVRSCAPRATIKCLGPEPPHQ
jgi:hypothetical protein